MRATFVLFLLASLLLSGACTQVPASIAAGSDESTPTGIISPTATPLPIPSPTPEADRATATPAPEKTDGGPPTPPADEGMAIDADLLALGRDVYRQQACGVCHTLAAVESLGTFGPPQDNLAVNAAERILGERYKGAATTPEEYIRESIISPQAFLVEGYQITRFPMPIFTNLSAQEVDALVYLLMQPPTTAVP